MRPEPEDPDHAAAGTADVDALAEAVEDVFYDPTFFQATGVLMARRDVTAAKAADLIRLAATSLGVSYHEVAEVIAASCRSRR